MSRTARLIRWLTLLATSFVTSLACAATVSYSAILGGTAEAPPNASTGHGIATLTVDTVAHTMRVEASFTDLSGNVTAAHIHCCTLIAGAGTAGVATAVPTFPGFPFGVTSGSYDHLLDLTLTSSWNPSFVTLHGGALANAESPVLLALAGGNAYFNIHTTSFPGGEIRGFLSANEAPEPTVLALFACALLILGYQLRKTQADGRST